MRGTFMLKDLEPPESLGERQPLLHALRTVPLVSSPTARSQSPRAGDQGRRPGPGWWRSRAPGPARPDQEVFLSPAGPVPKSQKSSPAARCPGAGFPQAPW